MFSSSENGSSHVLLVNRRNFIVGAAILLSGCTTMAEQPPALQAATSTPPPRPNGLDYAAIYGALPDERFPVPAINVSKIDPTYLRQIVDYDSMDQVGTVVIDPGGRFLYLVMENGKAMRFGVGVGREGFGWSGEAKIRRKAKWPTWTPPRSMIERDPNLEQYANGMKPGLNNPLGARALYLFQGERDTLYRIHGTNDPSSIGKSVSSGCIRMFNQDVIDLFNRVPIDTKVIVLGSTAV